MEKWVLTLVEHFIFLLLPKYLIFMMIFNFQACIAFAYITIPSISSHFQQLQAHLLTAQVAYQCHCLGKE